MTLISWSDDLSIGVDTIDAQHQKLIDMVNDAYDAVFSGGDPDAAFDLIERMKAYALEHFAAEERMMEECGYPETGEHKQRHLQFLQEVFLFNRDKYKRDQLLEIFTFLSSWFKEHIRREDKAIAAFMTGSNE
ncbi:bacteriohemerythrin [Pseudodesulfovibrio tunisiensis]|uniref:bacteriohemerythrin n=1 Tax=Pseudodesulfovibrio tunisiensis TaxID=463192 RepID=UPI001FB4BD27|nr:bacteriohemerythrin [Pseudodesulfovibrio tunisiensis]